MPVSNLKQFQLRSFIHEIKPKLPKTLKIEAVDGQIKWQDAWSIAMAMNDVIETAYKAELVKEAERLKESLVLAHRRQENLVFKY